MQAAKPEDHLIDENIATRQAETNRFDGVAPKIKQEVRDDFACSNIEIKGETPSQSLKSECIPDENMILKNIPVGVGTAPNLAAPFLPTREEVVSEIMTDVSYGKFKEEFCSHKPFSLNFPTRSIDQFVAFKPERKKSFDDVVPLMKEEMQHGKNDPGNMLHTSIDIKEEPSEESFQMEIVSEADGSVTQLSLENEHILNRAAPNLKTTDVFSGKCDATLINRDGDYAKIRNACVKLVDLFPAHVRKIGEAHSKSLSCVCIYCRSEIYKVTSLKSETEEPFNSEKASYSLQLECDSRSQTSTQNRCKSYKCEDCPTKADYRCDQCRLSFKEKCGLKKHMVVHSYDKPFRCSNCSKSFKRKDSLKSHLAVHSPKKPFTCSLCSASFKERTNLTKHMSIHSGEKPFRCDQCSASFRQKCHLKNHMMVHSRKKPFSCCQCSAYFKDRTYLKKHMLIHTDARPFRCEHCSASFKRKMHVKTHMSIHHL